MGNVGMVFLKLVRSENVCFWAEFDMGPAHFFNTSSHIAHKYEYIKISMILLQRFTRVRS